MATLIVPAMPGSVQAASVDEEKLTKLKAAYLYNLLKFSHWPEHKFSDDSDPIRVVILGETPVAKIFLHAVKERTAQDRPIHTDHLNYPPHDANNDESSAEDSQEALDALHDRLRDYHMVFIGKALQAHWPALHNELSGAGVLLVSDMDQFAHHGGMVGLCLNKEKRLGFVVNIDALEADKLRLSASLMKLAEVLRGAQSSIAPPAVQRLTIADRLKAVLAWCRSEGGLCS